MPPHRQRCTALSSVAGWSLKPVTGPVQYQTEHGDRHICSAAEPLGSAAGSIPTDFCASTAVRRRVQLAPQANRCPLALPSNVWCPIRACLRRQATAAVSAPTGLPRRRRRLRRARRFAPGRRPRPRPGCPLPLCPSALPPPQRGLPAMTLAYDRAAIPAFYPRMHLPKDVAATGLHT